MFSVFVFWGSLVFQTIKSQIHFTFPQNVSCQNIIYSIYFDTNLYASAHEAISWNSGWQDDGREIGLNWVDEDWIHALDGKTHEQWMRELCADEKMRKKRKDGNITDRFFHSNEDRLIQSHMQQIRSLINCLCVEAKLQVWQQLLYLSSLWPSYCFSSHWSFIKYTHIGTVTWNIQEYIKNVIFEISTRWWECKLFTLKKWQPLVLICIIVQSVLLR